MSTADLQQVIWAGMREQNCALGYHAWTPWLRLDNGSFVVWCVNCRHEECFDL